MVAQEVFVKNLRSKASLAFFLVICLTRQVYAQTPTRLEEIPLFAGMELVSEETAPAEQGLLSGIRRVYNVKAPIEDVIAFYEKKLGISKRFEDAEDQNNLEVGGAVDPTIQVYFWNDSEFVDGDFGEGGFSRRAWIKKELEKRKKDKEEGAWIESANSEWYYRDTKDTMTTLHIMFQDLSINEEEHNYDVLTEVIIEVVNYEYEL